MDSNTTFLVARYNGTAIQIPRGAPYKAAEPQRFVQYYESEARRSAVVLASADGNY